MVYASAFFFFFLVLLLFVVPVLSVLVVFFCLFFRFRRALGRKAFVSVVSSRRTRLSGLCRSSPRFDLLVVKTPTRY